MVKLTIIRILYAIVLIGDLFLEHMDFKVAYIHGDLKEEIYMLQPMGFDVSEKEHLVCNLIIQLYGLK